MPTPAKTAMAKVIGTRARCHSTPCVGNTTLNSDSSGRRKITPPSQQ